MLGSTDCNLGVFSSTVKPAAQLVGHARFKIVS